MKFKNKSKTAVVITLVLNCMLCIGVIEVGAYVMPSIEENVDNINHIEDVQDYLLEQQNQLNGSFAGNTDAKINDTIEVTIEKLDNNNVVCIGQISLGKNISYQLDISAENGQGLFVGLSTSNQLSKIKGNTFSQAYGLDGLSNTVNAYFTADKPILYYVYIGNNSKQAESKIEKITGSLKSTPLNVVDNAAIKILEYSGSWDMVENYLPNMSKDGIDKAVEIYNQKNYYTSSQKKKSSDYYNIKSNSADKRALNITELTGTWQYIHVLFPYMTNDGIDQVVAAYNQKHSSNKKIASDYYN